MAVNRRVLGRRKDIPSALVALDRRPDLRLGRRSAELNELLELIDDQTHRATLWLSVRQLLQAIQRVNQ